ncbi:hypothetical protein FRUB_07748 [Fimbriiglobus ruber]|uniref:Uncharacterized protein n=1 Tax=Fimbriiglobus ruber TaxID=1908690 RepID=A0A225DJ66_9BACT|nr:hypothetical protein FRUB_07748 [Fimbriiglobus ruber]
MIPHSPTNQLLDGSAGPQFATIPTVTSVVIRWLWNMLPQ